jgi:hypothetical protein
VGIAENDFDGWQTHSGQYVKVRFGAVYALYLGEDIGQGGVSLKFEADPSLSDVFAEVEVINGSKADFNVLPTMGLPAIKIIFSDTHL